MKSNTSRATRSTWQTGLRVAVCAFNIIAIAGLGWLMSTMFPRKQLIYGLDVSWPPGFMTTFGVSLIYCLLCVIAPFVRKAHSSRPVYTGVAVAGADFVLWIAFLLTAVFTLPVISSIAQWGEGDTIADPVWRHDHTTTIDYTGFYNLTANGTWVYTISYVFNETAPQWDPATEQMIYTPIVPNYNTTGVVRDCSEMFHTCEQQDQWVNDTWHLKHRGLAVAVLINVAEWSNFILHFALSVWACYDIYYLWKTRSASRDEVIEKNIIADSTEKV